jgi:hypothetical protein
LPRASRLVINHSIPTPAEVQKAATQATGRLQQRLKAIPGDELLAAMIPVLRDISPTPTARPSRSSMTHPPDQKLVKNTNAMMIDTMQAAQAVRNKHMPEIEAQIEKTAAGASQPALTQPK